MERLIIRDVELDDMPVFVNQELTQAPRDFGSRPSFCVVQLTARAKELEDFRSMSSVDVAFFENRELRSSLSCEVADFRIATRFLAERVAREAQDLEATASVPRVDLDQLSVVFHGARSS